jgi:eukaryotic-like serine/threonine-protein kinase
VEPTDTLIQQHAVHSNDAIRAFDERPRRGDREMLGRYRPIERLGAGGFGVVWRAHDELLHREVALKRIALPAEEDRERAAREALATARLAHPAIVALYEAATDGDAFYLISELVDGQTLGELMHEEELSDEEILEIGVALCDALGHAHGRGVIHRDVKPSNVLVPYEQPGRGGGGAAVAKLADFGGARLAGEQTLTRAGDVLGTLAYMAPEQSEGLEAGPEADLYSLALVLYEALSGSNPVRGRTPAATARRIGLPIEPLQRRRRDLPRELTWAIDGALHPDPAERGTLEDLRAALADAIERGPRRGLLARRRRAPAFRPAPLAPGRPSMPVDAHPGHAPASIVGFGPPWADSDRPELLGAPSERARARRRVALPKLVWIGCAPALAIWQAASGRPGVALLVLAAAAPLVLLPRRAGPGWLLAGFAPALGLAGLAGAFPALAGQRASWRARAALAALGFWWLALAEPLAARRLWEGPAAGLPARAAWEGSLSSAATHTIAPIFTLALLAGAVVWAAGAAILPVLVRGRNAALDVVAAVAWMVALLAAPAPILHVLDPGLASATPRGALLGAALGCAVAICARALRGPS